MFTEAMYYGLPVVAGNADGSSDALMEGKAAQLVDPGSVLEIKAAIVLMLENQNRETPEPELLEKEFGYTQYQRRINTLLNGEFN